MNRNARAIMIAAWIVASVLLGVFSHWYFAY